MLWTEAELVVERMNGLEATRAVLLQMAVASVLSEEAAKGFNQAVSRMIEG